MEKKITNWQFASLIVNTVQPTAVLSIPGFSAGYAGQEAWICVILATLMALVVLFGAGTLANMFPGVSLDGIAERLVGPWFGKLVGFLFINYFLFMGVVILREYMSFMSTVFMPNTPSWVFATVSVLLSSYAVFQGLVVFARINVILLVTSFGSFFLSTIFTYSNMRFENLLPLWDQPFSHLFLGAYVPGSWMSECAILLFFAPYVKEPRKMMKYGAIGLVIIGLILLWAVIGAVAGLGAKLLPHLNFPMFNVFRVIKVSNFLEHIDAVFIAVWISTLFAKSTIFFFGFHIALKRTFKLSSEKPFLLPSSLLWALLSMSSWATWVEFHDNLFFTIPPTLLSFNLGIVYLLLVIALFRVRRRDRRKVST